MSKEQARSAEKSPEPEEKPRESDAYLDAIVERTIAPYRGLVTPEVLALMREMVEESLTEDEVGRELLDRARPRIVAGSTVLPKDEAATPEERAARRGDG